MGNREDIFWKYILKHLKTTIALFVVTIYGNMIMQQGISWVVMGIDGAINLISRSLLGHEGLIPIKILFPQAFRPKRDGWVALKDRAILEVSLISIQRAMSMWLKQ